MMCCHHGRSPERHIAASEHLLSADYMYTLLSSIQHLLINVILSAVFTCIGALGTPAERGPSLESIYRVSLTVDLCEG